MTSVLFDKLSGEDPKVCQWECLDGEYSAGPVNLRRRKGALAVISVMPGLVPGIHVFGLAQRKAWMAGTSPAMTNKRTQFRPPDGHPMPVVSA